MAPNRFNSFQVTLHWSLAGLLITSLMFGLFYLHPLPNDASKIAPLRIHMLIGIVIGVLLAASMVVRVVTAQPDRLRSGHAAGDWLAALVHAALRIAVVGMLASGVALSVQAGLFASVFAHAGVPLPRDMAHFRPHQVHALVARILIALTALHVVGALFHQLVRKDRPFARMGRRA